MTAFQSPRRWPATVTLRSFGWLGEPLHGVADQIGAFLTGAPAHDELPIEALGAYVVRLPDPDLPGGTYFGLRIADTLVPCRLTDGRVRVGLAGECTNTLFDLTAEMLAASGGKLEGPAAVAFATRVYRDLTGATAAELAGVPACPACSTDAPRVDAPIARCARCEAVYRTDADDGDWRETYADVTGRYFNGIAEPAGVSSAHGYEDYEEWSRVILGPAHFDTRTGWIERVTGHVTGRALDVGCATGQMVAALARKGWRVSGVDLSRFCVDRARTLCPDAEFVAGTLADCGGDWDLVTYLDVFEHLADPRAELAEIHRRLRPGGWLVLELPNQASIEAEILGTDYLFGEHQYFYGPRAIGMLLSSAGFRVEAVATSHDAYFRADRITGAAMAADLLAGQRGERMLVAGQRV